MNPIHVQLWAVAYHYGNSGRQMAKDTIRYDTIEEFNVDSKQKLSVIILTLLG